MNQLVLVVGGLSWCRNRTCIPLGTAASAGEHIPQRAILIRIWSLRLGACFWDDIEEHAVNFGFSLTLASARTHPILTVRSRYISSQTTSDVLSAPLCEVAASHSEKP